MALANACQTVLAIHRELDNTQVIQAANEIYHQLKQKLKPEHPCFTTNAKVTSYAILYGSLLRSGNKIYMRTVKEMCGLALGSPSKTAVKLFLEQSTFIEAQINTKFQRPNSVSDILPHFAHILKLSGKASELAERLAEIGVSAKNHNYDTTACAIAITASRCFEPEVGLSTASRLCEIGEDTLRDAAADFEYTNSEAILRIKRLIVARVQDVGMMALAQEPMEDKAMNEVMECTVGSTKSIYAEAVDDPDVIKVQVTSFSDDMPVPVLNPQQAAASRCSTVTAAREEADTTTPEAPVKGLEMPDHDESLLPIKVSADYKNIPRSSWITAPRQQQERQIHCMEANPDPAPALEASVEPSPWSLRRASAADAPACLTCRLEDRDSGSDSLLLCVQPPSKYRRVVMPTQTTPGPDAPSAKESVQTGGDEQEGGATVVYACVDSLPPVVVVVNAAGDELIDLD